MVSDIQWACVVLLSAFTASAPLRVIGNDGVELVASGRRPVERVIEAAPIAVIVNSSNPMSTVGLGELRRLFLGQSQTLPNRARLQLVESPAVRPAFYRAVLGMTEDRVRRHWIGIVFQGEGATPPNEFSEEVELLRFVRATPGAVAFIHSAHVDNSVKILAIDGRLPTDPTYPFR